MPPAQTGTPVNGAAIRAIRQARGWRSTKFALELEISHSHLANIEAGRKPRIGADIARRIADTLEVPLAAITSGRSVEEVA